MTLRSSLAPYSGSMREPDPTAARRIAERAWIERGFVAIDPAWITGWPDRELLMAIAVRVHGERPSG